MITGEWGRKGSPWEFNIRDVMRWCQLIDKHQVNSLSLYVTNYRASDHSAERSFARALF